MRVSVRHGELSVAPRMICWEQKGCSGIANSAKKKGQQCRYLSFDGDALLSPELSIRGERDAVDWPTPSEEQGGSASLRLKGDALSPPE